MSHRDSRYGQAIGVLLEAAKYQFSGSHVRELRERTGAKASPFAAGIQRPQNASRSGVRTRRSASRQRRMLGSWSFATAQTAILRPYECLSCGIERGTSAPIPGQSDNLRQPTALSERPSLEVVGRCDKSTSESSRILHAGVHIRPCPSSQPDY
jgi:hypothetical protein